MYRTPSLLLLTVIGVRASLPAQGAAVDLRGIYVGGNSIINENPASLSAALSMPAIDGLTLVIGWSDLEPSRGVYQFAPIDQWIGQAITDHKKVTLSVSDGLNAPSWLFLPPPVGGGAIPLAFSIARKAGRTDSCLPDTIAAPWDRAFLGQWDTMVTALAAHLKAAGLYNAVVLLRLGGINMDSDELHLPSETAQSTGLACVSDAVGTWLQAGYKPSLLLQGWDALTSTYQRNFPDKSFTVAIIASAHPFPAIAEDSSVITSGLGALGTIQNQPLMMLASQKFPGHLVIQNNSLYPDVPAQPETVQFAQTLGTLLAFQTNEDIGTANGKSASCTKPPAGPTECTDSAYLKLLETGIVPIDAGDPLRAQYIEIFAADAVAHPASILSAQAELVPPPTIASLSPTHALAGGGVALTVTGTNFVPSSLVAFNGKTETTAFVSASQLTATVPAADNASGGQVAVSVVRSPAGGLGVSAAANFTADGFTLRGPANPDTVTAGQSAQFAITVAAGNANGFASPVTFAATGLPAGATATFNQNPVTPGVGTTIATMTIHTSIASLALGLGDGGGAPAARFAIVGGVLGLSLLLAWKSWLRGGFRPAVALPLATALVLLLIVSACSSAPPHDGGAGTPAGTSQIAVTATSGTASQQVVVQLTVR